MKPRPNYPLSPSPIQVIYHRWETRLFLELLTFQKAGALFRGDIH